MPPLRRAWIFALTSARDSGFVSNIRRRIESNFLSATALPLIDTEYQLSDMRDRDDHSPELLPSCPLSLANNVSGIFSQ